MERSRRGLRWRSWLLVLLCACAGAQLERSVTSDPWLAVQAGPYRIVGDLAAEPLLALARRLLIFDRVTHLVTDAREQPPRVPTTVLVLAHGGYAQLGMPRSTAGLFVATARGNTVFLDARADTGVAAEAILYHEYGHFVLHNSSSFSYPAWYDEGMAEMLRSTQIDEDGASFGDLLPERIATLRAGLMPSERLFTLRSPLALGAREIQMFYAQAWLTVLYLRYAGVLAQQVGLPVRGAQMLRYLELHDRGIPVHEAFARAFGISFAELDRELGEFLRRGSTAIKYIRKEELGPLPALELRVLRPAEAAEALASAALSSGRAYGVAERLFARAVSLEPTRTRSAFGLARTRLARGRRSQLEALFERARALDPEDALGQLDYAEYLLWKADRGPEPQAAELARRAAALLESAAQREPRLPEARYQLARAYSVADQPERMRLALDQAYELLPSDSRIAYAVAHRLGRERRFAEARRVATRALAGSHDPEAAAELEALMAEWAASARRPAP